MTAAEYNAQRRDRYANDPEYRERRKEAARCQRAARTPEQRKVALTRLRAWQEAHPEKARASVAAAKERFSARNPGKSAEYSLRSRLKDPDGYRARKRADKARERARSPERVRARERSNQLRRRAQTREPISRLRVFQRDEGLCGLCGLPADRQDFHLDHVLPLARGGEHSYANVQVSHPDCNVRKGARVQEEVA